MALQLRHPFFRVLRIRSRRLTAISSKGEIPMNRKQLSRSKKTRIFTWLSVAAIVLLASSGTSAQTQRKAGAAHPDTPDESPLFHEYRGVQLGMTADEVRKKLGIPKDKSEEQDFFIFNDTETAQVVYDKTQKVITISADFSNPTSAVITAREVFGAEIQPKPDGSVYKMVRYTKAGYWLSYNRTSGASPLITVTLQKIQ
ncbi:MAG TPA: hypothetical protein DCK93_14025 [Blastocatellia bacterium]|nr:hypothetical protein [Blastocatellia bacterium]